jgi:membrane associated rhomboid family serine protease
MIAPAGGNYGSKYKVQMIFRHDFGTEVSMKRGLSILLSILLILGAVGFVFEPVSSAQTTTTATTRHRYHRHRRSFWQKHRDKLTVAGSALGGAAIGGIAGGKKGAAIGTLAGAGTGAVYTYKIRKRHRHYRRY